MKQGCESNLRDSFKEWEEIPTLSSTGVQSLYQINQQIGEGATCTVYRGTQVSTNATIAAKKIKNENLLQVLQESKLQASITHPNIPSIIDVFRENDDLFIIQEYAEGIELFEILCQRKLNNSEQNAIISQLLDIIDHLHNIGIVHGDIKAENIIYNEKTQKIYLIDFGSAFSSRNLHACTTGGSLGYMAPELLKGQSVSPQSDLWAVGVLLYIMALGFPPFFSDPDFRTNSNLLLNAPFWFFNNAATCELYKEIESGVLHCMDGISSLTAYMLKNLLSVNPTQRTFPVYIQKAYCDQFEQLKQEILCASLHLKEDLVASR